MKKLLGLTLCVMFVILTFATSVYATTYNYDSFTAGSGYGTATKVDDNVTNLKGDATLTDGMHMGPYSKASNAKLADGITEEAYIEINPENMTHGEHFEVSLALKDGENNYVSEAIVMTQKVGDAVKVTSSVKDSFAATITESGVYTYQWKMWIEDGEAYVKFTLLKDDTVIGATGIVEFDEISSIDVDNIADQEDVSVKYLWFCGIDVAEGVNVYAELPKIVDEPTEEPKDEPTEEPKDEPTEEPKDEPTEEPKEEKDETPKTGSIDVIAYAGAAVAVITLAGIVTVKKYNK